jgi:xanthine dehydrogenase accessory factor
MGRMALRQILWQKLQRLHDSGTDAVVVTVIGARGSIPTDAGAKMLVTADGLQLGTVGGGKIESRAIAEAQAILGEAAAPICQTRCWNLQRDIGMTCGGEMTLLFEVEKAEATWRIFIFGAGHVSQALVPVLATLSCRITVFDVREDWLDRLPALENVATRWVENFEDGVEEITPGGFALAITKGHATDLPVLREIFRKFGNLPFVGAIGSRSKRAVMERELRESEISQEKIDSLVCPLGLPIGSNSPEEIAISIVAQLLELRDLRKKQ